MRFVTKRSPAWTKIFIAVLISARIVKERFNNCELFILITPILSNTAQSMATNNKSHHHRTPKRLNFSRSLEPSENFLCGEPQSRSYNLRDLMQTVHTNSEIVNFPLYIVSKRCDVHSGCCKSFNMSCTPVESAIYHDEIEIEIESLQTNRTRKQWIRIEQHGECICAVTNSDQRNYSTPNIEML
ncbi:platelet-derived growth factor subunit A-like [Vespula maculifrons]|uniref:Platelet-derived growth factor (PDGF) family profile domain-containing protein n=2 Tax=Vespula TaxID=7451 RepID=A0A834JY68_VESVU|nr:hypothetical protein HZH66_007469 [Vespula vulgaris]